jgi:predicted secreted Zn-dependent protease
MILTTNSEGVEYFCGHHRENVRSKKLRKEVADLRAFVIGLAVSRDPEGRYKSRFTREILSASREKSAKHFRGAKNFLAELRHKKRA